MPLISYIIAAYLCYSFAGLFGLFVLAPFVAAAIYFVSVIFLTGISKAAKVDE